MTIGSWQKAGTTSQIAFSDDKGAPLKLNAGQTWITLVGTSNLITYGP